MDVPTPALAIPPKPQHLPVMPVECAEQLALTPGATILDATLGLGGHAVLSLETIGPQGCLIGLDRDANALGLATTRLRDAAAEWGWQSAPVKLARTDFRDLGEALDEIGVSEIDAALFDLGVSSMQLDRAERGFSFRHDGPLDMRMDDEQELTAADLVNTESETELARIMWEWGEERYSRRIARRIVERRERGPYRTTGELADTIRLAYPAKDRHGRLHPATRSFQAFRIAVNDELAAIGPGIRAAAARLRPGGRLVVLAYHSLEDRIVKRTLEFLSGRCACPPELPACMCGTVPVLRILARKPLEPTAAEIDRNPRARSARLRAAERRTE